MASSFTKSLLAAAVAFVVSGTLSAQDKFQEGVRLLRLGGKENEAKALEAFREVVKTDPSNADAMKYVESISRDEWYMLLSQQGEVGKIAQSILDRAKVERTARSRDEAVIEALVETATAEDATYEQRREAQMKLIASHGEFAVPALAARLGNPDLKNGQTYAIMTAVQINRPAVLPLIELLKSSNATLRLNAAAALSIIGDLRAAAALAALAQSDDQETVRNAAHKFLQKHGIAAHAVDLHLAQARAYLTGGIGNGDFSEVVWTMADDKLVARDVPPLVYAAELAKASALDGVKSDPVSADARSVLAQANLAEANLIENSAMQGDEVAKSLAGLVPEFKMAALATGPAVLRTALDEGLKRQLPNVSVGAIEALAMVEDREVLGQSSLVHALDSTDKRVRYAAAAALVKASSGVGVPAADKVVDALAQAVTEESVRTIQVIGATEDMALAARQASSMRGIAAACDANAVRGLQSLLVNPGTDVVVIQEILPDRLPEDVIANIKKDPRMANTKIVIVAKDAEAAKARFGESIHGVVASPLTGENLIAAVNTALEGVAVEAHNMRAEGYAKGASEALLDMAAGRSGIAMALGSLAAQLNRGDSVAVPAAKALGISGTPGQLDPLLAALQGGGSVDLKVAVANAIGMILGRANDCPAAVADGLVAAMGAGADIKVRVAVAAALGKAKLDDARKAKLLESLRKIGSPASS